LVTPLTVAQTFHPFIPRAWDDSETTSFELPLAQADRSPPYPSAKEYYSLAVRPVYRTYPFYTPNKEPAGYWESLQQKEAEVVFDPAKLKTKEDWIRAGELVFDQPIHIVPPQRARLFLGDFDRDHAMETSVGPLYTSPIAPSPMGARISAELLEGLREPLLLDGSSEDRDIDRLRPLHERIVEDDLEESFAEFVSVEFDCLP